MLPHLAASGPARKRFAREGRAVAAVVDDHVMAIHGVDEWQGLIRPRTSETPSPMRSIRDQTCDVFAIEYPDQNKSYRIAFSRELGGFPIQVERSANDKYFATLDVIKTHKDRSGAILAIELQSTLVGESSKLESAVDVSTLRINEPIDPAKFKFDPVGIEIVVDVDAKEKAKQERLDKKD